MSKWKADERLRKAQRELDDSRDHLDFAIELAQNEGAPVEAINPMKAGLVLLDEIMDNLSYAQGLLRRRQPAGDAR